MRLFIIIMVFMLGLAPVAMAAEEGEGGSKGPHPDFEYIQLDPILLPVITAKGPTQQLNLMIQLEVDYGTKDEVSPYIPRLVDAYLQDLYGALGNGHALMKEGFVNVVEIKKRLTDVTEKIMGDKHDEVKGVLLQVVQQRPL